MEEDIQTKKGLMNYLDEFNELKTREEESQKILNNIYKTLDILKTSLSLTYGQMSPTEKQIKHSISDEEFKDKVDSVFQGVSLKMDYYFKNNFSLLALKVEESNTLFDCIKQLVKIITEQQDKIEGFMVDERTTPQPEPTPEKKQEEKKIEPKETTEDDLFRDEIITDDLKSQDPEETSEEEEECSNIKNVYECTGCKNISTSAHANGCTKCGEPVIKVKYLK